MLDALCRIDLWYAFQLPPHTTSWDGRHVQEWRIKPHGGDGDDRGNTDNGDDGS